MFKYFGGKSRLAPRIAKRIPPHETWVEPFAGGASVTLQKPPSRREVLSDKRADVIRFYRHVKAGARIKLPAASKKVFKRIRNKPEISRTPGEFVRLQANSFGGDARTFAEGTGSTGTLLNKRLPEYAARLHNTTILNQDFRSVIKKFDSPRSLLYLDPPYPQDKTQYKDYGRDIPTIHEVKSSLTGVKSKWLLSYPDIPQVRRAFPETRYDVTRFRLYRPLTSFNPGPKTRTELLISNFNTEDVLG